MKLKLEIVTPEKKVYSDEVDSVVIPGVEGELGILPHHIPLMVQILPGELRVKKGNEELNLATGGGFVEVTGKSVKVLTDMAERAEDINEARVEEARCRAEEALKERHLSAEEYATTAATLQKALAQLRVVRKRRH
ncbi:MAG: F0F1 ATP synthase subunit epsilon [Patescibacteria group bacterium]|nr:F0F1 ATP synthase subunit epsilon [Patescibacteria group bacterium]